MHMMDQEHHECIFSEGFVDLNPTSIEYYDKKLEKIFYHANLKEIEVGNFASIILRCKQMFESDEQYQEHSRVITKEWFDIASMIQDMPNSNLLFIQTRVDGQDHMVILKLNYKVASVMVNEEHVMRITSRQMVPSKSQGIEEAIIVNIETNQVFIIEKKFMIDGKMNYYINEQYLKGQPKMTDKEKMKVMNKALTAVEDHYHVHSFETPVLVKKALSDCLVENKEVKPIEIASKLMEGDYGAQEECVEMMKDQGVREDDVVVMVDGIEKMRRCKIITDTEVEIQVNVEDYLSGSTIKKVYNDDGSISLVISGVHDLVVK